MPFSAVAASVAGAAVSAGLNAALNSGDSSSGGGSSGPNPMNYNQPFVTGVHLTNTPMAGEKAQAPVKATPGKVAQGTAANPRSTPTQAQGAGYASKDYQGMWADRLSKYLDYNTRNLG